MKEKLYELDKQIKVIKLSKRELIQKTQVECSHPFDKLLDIPNYLGYSNSWETYRICSCCFLAECEPFSFICDRERRYEEVPKVSRKYIDALYRLDRDDKYILEYPMRFKAERLKEVREEMGEGLWSKYINRKPHIVWNGEDHNNEIKQADIKGLSKRWFEFGNNGCTVWGTYSDDYLEELK